jgi:hypothetical protein
LIPKDFRSILVRSILVLLLIFISVTFGESHPTWWTYASPDATALVGIERDALRGSILEAAVEEELTGDGSLGLPKLELLRKARQLLISSPDFLVIATGRFPAAAVRDEASKNGFKRVVHHDVELWVPASQEEMSLARVSDQLLLVGARQTLQSAIERRETGVQTSPPEQGAKTEFVKRYSPLLPRASRFAQADLWVIASALPDPLASRFAPIEVQAKAFEGGLSVRDGLRIRATMSAASPAWAKKIAAQLKQSSEAWPAMLRAMEITPEADRVDLTLSLEGTKLTQSSKEPASKDREPKGVEPKDVASKTEPPAPKPAPVPIEIAVFVNGTATAPSLLTASERPALPAPAPPPTPVAAAPVAKPAPPAPAAAAPPAHRVIRIFGLDEGVREIELPPAR